MSEECHSSISTTPRPPGTYKNYRLPKSLKPYFYDLTINTTFDVYTEPINFNGNLTIHLNCLESTNLISLHKADIDINLSTVSIQSLTGILSQYSVVSTSYDDDTEIFNMTLSQSLEAGQNYSLNMAYTGLSQANNFGFYKSFYIDETGKKKYIFVFFFRIFHVFFFYCRWLITSQMESTAARSGFPCFDEPAMKAKFKLTVIYHNSLKALSNMPITLTEDL